MDSQERQILAYLEQGHSIEPFTAIGQFGCYRLSARIYDLRSKGYKITSSMEYYTNQKGERKKYARYWLKETQAEG